MPMEWTCSNESTTCFYSFLFLNTWTWKSRFQHCLIWKSAVGGISQQRVWWDLSAVCCRRCDHCVRTGAIASHAEICAMTECSTTCSILRDDWVYLGISRYNYRNVVKCHEIRMTCGGRKIRSLPCTVTMFLQGLSTSFWASYAPPETGLELEASPPTFLTLRGF